MPLVEFAFDSPADKKHANMSPGITPGLELLPRTRLNDCFSVRCYFCSQLGAQTAALGKGGTNMYELRDAQARPPIPGKRRIRGMRARTLSRPAYAKVSWPGGFRQLSTHLLGRLLALSVGLAWPR